MKEIPLTQGKVALVDDEDFEELSKHKWYFHNGYALRNDYRKETPTKIMMHRAILGITDSRMGDHINGNTLDNRRGNLRSCNSAQNTQNRSKKTKTSGQYKGITFHRKIKKWQVMITKNGKANYLGCYESETQAAKVYDEAAIKLFGSFARLNFPEVLL